MVRKILENSRKYYVDTFCAGSLTLSPVCVPCSHPHPHSRPVVPHVLCPASAFSLTVLSAYKLKFTNLAIASSAVVSCTFMTIFLPLPPATSFSQSFLQFFF